MDPRHHARLLAAEAARDTWCEARVPAADEIFAYAQLPPGAGDGAVIELQVHDDGLITGEVRIPGPPVP